MTAFQNLKGHDTTSRLPLSPEFLFAPRGFGVSAKAPFPLEIEIQYPGPATMQYMTYRAGHSGILLATYNFFFFFRH